MTAKEELISVIERNIIISWNSPKSISELTQAILDALPDLVEIDEEKIYSLLWDDGIVPSGCDRGDCKELAKAISQAKRIIKVKG